MAFRKKCQYLDITGVDMLIVQECESPERFNAFKHNLQYTDFIWYGDNIHKGIGIFTFNDYQVEIRKDHNPVFRYIIPLTVQGPNRNYNLYAVWAMPHATDRKQSYVGQIIAAVDYYNDWDKSNTLLVGDYNSNSIWNGSKKYGNHADLMQKLNKANLYSVYHKLYEEGHGEESTPTQYMYKHLDKPYHLDYCSMSEALFSADISLEIGNFEEWKAYSDHMPIWIRGIKQE